MPKRDISEVEHIGIDEKSFLKGHNYLTALNDLDEGCVLVVVPERTEEVCRQLIGKALPREWSRFKIEAMAVDMWSAFRNAVKALLPSCPTHPSFTTASMSAAIWAGRPTRCGGPNTSSS